MTRRRWIADEFAGERAWLLGANAAHLARVLRAREGEEYDIVCGGELRAGTVVSVTAERVEFALGERREDWAESEREIVLVAAVYKFDRLEWAIEKCTELGVTHVLPVMARRTDAHLAGAAAKRVERWRRIAHEAAQQSRRMAAPQIEEPVKVKAAVQRVAGTRLLLNEAEKSVRLRDALNIAGNGSIALAVGPEGGWTAEEMAEFAAAGWTSVSLGTTILRAETAAIAALAVVKALLD